MLTDTVTKKHYVLLYSNNKIIVYAIHISQRHTLPVLVLSESTDEFLQEFGSAAFNPPTIRAIICRAKIQNVKIDTVLHPATVT